MILATHVILTGYGHWLPNDARGSYSEEVFIPKIAELGPIHHGRKPVQPSPQELRGFHKQAGKVLTHPVHWFSPEERAAIRDAFARVCKEQRFICHACAIMPNHVHALIRRNYLHSDKIHNLLKQCAIQAVKDCGQVSSDHPVFSAGVGTKQKWTPAEVRQCVKYIQDNFAKHRLPFEQYEFVTEYYISKQNNK